MEDRLSIRLFTLDQISSRTVGRLLNSGHAVVEGQVEKIGQLVIVVARGFWL